MKANADSPGSKQISIGRPDNALSSAGVVSRLVGGSVVATRACSLLLTVGASFIGAAVAGQPTLNVSPKTTEVSEHVGVARVKFRLSSASDKSIIIGYEARMGNAGGAATPGEDFKAFKSSVTIPAGKVQASVAIPIVDDKVVEDRERFQVALTSAQNATIGTFIGFVDILDDDGAGFQAPPAAELEPGPYVYLDDADQGTKASALLGGFDPFAGLEWPRIGLADSPTGQSVEKLAKYHVLASHNTFKAGKAQKISPDLVYLRPFNPSSFQPSVDAMPFGSAGPATEGNKVFAGHWVYKPGTKLSKSISAGATTIQVADANKIEAGSYVVIYDAPAGSFKNAEHLYVKSVNKSTNTLTVSKRGYKSIAISHPASSVIAQHALSVGLMANGDNWVYNLSMACPLDAKGNTLSEVMVDWLSNNYDRLSDGRQVSVRVDGLHFDTDRYFMVLDKEADVDNDLAMDNGVDSAGYNMWGEGVENFYADLRAALPDLIMVGGGKASRGWETLNGIQSEGFPLKGDAFAVNPNYGEIDAQLANYGLHVRRHDIAPSLTMALSKAPTKLYPNLEPSHRTDGSEGSPKSNAPFRLSFGLALMDNGFYGQPSSGDHKDVWWDEYAVDVVPGSPTFGHAIPTDNSDESLLRMHRGWMGMPLGERVRFYDPNAFSPTKSVIANGSFENGLDDWSGSNLSVATDTSTGDYLEGSKALRASKPIFYGDKSADAKVLGPNVYLQKDQEYTFAFAVKSSIPREIRVGVGGSTSQLFLVDTNWVRRVIGFKATKTGNHRIKFDLGREESKVWIDAVYLFKGNASVFQRDFENARVVVNATPTARTIDLGGTFQRILGTGQDPINDGSTIRKVTVAPYDAAILVRP